MDRWRIACAVMGWLACVFAAQAAERAPSASLSITGDAQQPAGAPVILQLRVQNTGSVRMSYWCSGPGEYPDAADYVATVGGPHASLQKVSLSNGQRIEADGREIDVAPGQSIQFPVTLGMLAPGAYQVSVQGSAITSGPLGQITWPAMQSASPFQLEVRHDNNLAAARDATIVAGVRADNSFARFVASNWRTRAIRESLSADLLSDDIVAADRAADGLWGRNDPSRVDGPLLAEAIQKHLKTPPGECDVGLMARLTSGFGASDSPPVKAALTQLVLARPEGVVRREAAAALDRQLEPAANAKRLELARPDPGLQLTDEVQRRRHDAAMLAAMLELVRSEDVHERKLAYEALADFANKPEAARAIEAGLGDPDRDCQAAARKAWSSIIDHIATTQSK